jgi:hypothetical protein
MKKRGLASPDLADALALTFAYRWPRTIIVGSSPASRAINTSTTPSSRPGRGGCDVPLTQSLDARTHATAQNPL